MCQETLACMLIGFEIILETKCHDHYCLKLRALLSLRDFEIKFLCITYVGRKFN